METVTLLRCDRCHLQWVDDDTGTCPRCRRFHTEVKGVVMGGYEVAVASVTLFGAEMGLSDPRVRRNLKVWLGQKCPHGFIDYSICPECSVTYAEAELPKVDVGV